MENLEATEIYENGYVGILHKYTNDLNMKKRKKLIRKIERTSNYLFLTKRRNKIKHFSKIFIFLCLWICSVIFDPMSSIKTENRSLLFSILLLNKCSLILT